MQTVTTASRKPLLHERPKHKNTLKIKEKPRLLVKHLAFPGAGCFTFYH
jgi:hypothetical protein